MGNRFSSLGNAAKCAKSPALSQMGATRAAAMSTAFHATLASDPRAAGLMQLLSDDEVAEMIAWRRPQLIVLDADTALDWREAETEVELGLTAEGAYCTADDPACIGVGHMDGGWVKEVRGRRIAYIADHKRSAYTSADGPETLSMAAYGFSYADKHGCDAFVRGIWALVEGEWMWEPTMVDLNEAGAAELWGKVRAAILHTEGEYSMGSHCHSCYGRLRCPAYLMPPELAETSLAPFTGGKLPASTQELVKLKVVLDRVKDTAKAVEDALKVEAVQRGGLFDPDTGKWWRPIKMPGRKGLDGAALERDLPEVALKYTKQGKPYEQFKWVKS